MSEKEITSAVEVVYLLKELIRGRELLTASFNQGKESITTLLLDADRERNQIVFDGSRDESVNRNIASSAKIVFSGNLRGSKIQFAIGGAKAVTHRGATALAAKLPASVRHHQNRESFRVRASSATCTLPVPGRGYVPVPVQEMSVGGISLVLGRDAESFRLGQIVECQITMGSAGTLRCKLEVRAVKRMGTTMGIGCRFASLPSGGEAQISRFVLQQEREGNAKKVGGPSDREPAKKTGFLKGLFGL